MPLKLPGRSPPSFVAFIQRREKLYERAEKVVAQYGDNRFDGQLSAEGPGAVYQLFWRIEQLALSLQAKSEMEYKAKEFLKDMISDISHQLKTPLAALNMYMEIMTEEAAHEETVKKFTEKSMQSLNRMEQLIQSLLKIARLDTGNIVFEKRRCFVAEIAAEAAADFLERGKREGKKILLDADLEETVFCDFEWTKEAVGNLVSQVRPSWYWAISRLKSLSRPSIWPSCSSSCSSCLSYSTIPCIQRRALLRALPAPPSSLPA